MKIIVALAPLVTLFALETVSLAQENKSPPLFALAFPGHAGIDEVSELKLSQEGSEYQFHLGTTSKAVGKNLGTASITHTEATPLADGRLELRNIARACWSDEDAHLKNHPFMEWLCKDFTETSAPGPTAFLSCGGSGQCKIEDASGNKHIVFRTTAPFEVEFFNGAGQSAGKRVFSAN